MRVFEYRAYGTTEQYVLVDEAIRTARFIRNKCLRLWREAKDTEDKVGKYDLSRHSTELRHEFPWCKNLNSTAVQASAERSWSAIARFYKNVRHGVRPVGYPRFKKEHQARSVEYKHSGWKLDLSEKRIVFNDGFKIGALKLKGTWDTDLIESGVIRRVRLLRKADGYYVQFVVEGVDRVEYDRPTGKAIGLDMGLTHFYTDSEGHKVENPRYLRKSEKSLKRAQRRVSQKFRRGKKQTANYKRARKKLARKHLKVSRQRKDHAAKSARCVTESNDFIAYENLQVRNMVKNRHLAKSINDAGWSMFRGWLEYYGAVYGKVTVAVDPAYTSQECSSCGRVVRKSLSERTHLCRCGLVMDRDENAAKNILERGLRTVGHTETNAWGETVRPHSEASLNEPRIPSL